MNIAPATPEHASGIARVHIRSWQAAYAGILDQAFLDQLSFEDRAIRWEDILQRQESKTLIALQDDNVVGFINYGHWRDEQSSPEQGEIWALYADPESWSQGVGRALMAQALLELRALGYVEISLWVFGRNERGVNFYKSCGFSHVKGSEKQFELGGRQVEEVCLRFRNSA
ncbi:GNAT family N-acetyltransferase [Paucibacter sp. KBW04]|uniref:GNAT family N-acetyltransferase n=1 Tax=Paucibacter sp. KBW04 TaxID=2153361 RepID=UPI000F567612|nr:GNAT family N-acetyltransferase [Paucibacter sp. KBW04]RQO59335.1 GNAT family N-acetyltransferase [Paucibacter sp. KBW04]